MSSTIHRKDMASEDFHLLGSFSNLFNQADPNVPGRDFGLICLLDSATMNLPVWYKDRNIWRIGNFKQLVVDAVGIETSAMRNMCRWLGINEASLLSALFRFSMLSVVPGQNRTEPPKFRMPFCGDVKGFGGYVEPCSGFGFVIERRRLEGNFKSQTQFEV